MAAFLALVLVLITFFSLVVIHEIGETVAKQQPLCVRPEVLTRASLARCICLVRSSVSHAGRGAQPKRSFRRPKLYGRNPALVG